MKPIELMSVSVQNLEYPPKALDPAWTADLVELLKAPPAGEEAFARPDRQSGSTGVDEAAYA